MVKHGAATVTPRLRFPEFQRAAGWEEKSLVSACERITQGGTPDTSNPEYWDGGVAWLTPAEMGKSDDPKVTSTTRRITQDGLRACSSELLPMESVIISTRAPIGHLAINTVPMAINQGCKGLVSGANLDHRFLLSSLSRAKSRLVDLGAGNTFKELSASALKNFVIPLPLLGEQQKIADCLTSLDEVIAAQGRKVEALKAHKRGLMQQLFPREGETRPRLRFPEFRDAKEWDIKPLARVAANLDNKRIPITGQDRTQGNVPYYGASGIVDYVKGHIFDEDLLCVSEDGANLVTRTYPIAFPITGKTWVNNHAHVLRFEGPATQKLVEIYLNSIDLKDFITGMAQPKLNRSMLDTIPIPLPELAEQKTIADCLASLDSQIAAESNQLAALKTHKQGLMQQLFPAPEAASA